MSRFTGCMPNAISHDRGTRHGPMYVTGSDGVERIEKRKLMNISISCDHRVVDGWDAASFIQQLKRLIEAPANILAG